MTDPFLSVLMLFLGAAVAGPTGLVLVLPVLGVVTVVTETLGQIVSDRCLRERFRQARQLHASPQAVAAASRRSQEDV
jgi:predicted PurR-regulated permease PerM